MKGRRFGAFPVFTKMKMNPTKYFLAFTILIFTYSCASFNIPEKAKEIEAEYSDNPYYSNPRFVKGELITEIKKKQGAVVRDSSEVLIWSSNIKDAYNQRVVDPVAYSLKPTEVFVEKENGNEIAFWNLKNTLKHKDSVKIVRTFSAVTFDYSVKPDSYLVAQNWSSIPADLMKFYTKEEPFLEQTPVMRETLKRLLLGVSNPVAKARKIFLWVRKVMKYVYPPKQRGAETAFKTKEGDCGSYTALFISMCRIAGIPARQKSGFHFTPENKGSHVWSEIYLPPYGWTPVDATRKDGFCTIHNDVISASTGMNIPLKHAPAWANYSNSEVENGRTDFMQMCTVAVKGIDLEINVTRNVVTSEPLE